MALRFCMNRRKGVVNQQSVVDISTYNMHSHGDRYWYYNNSIVIPMCLDQFTKLGTMRYINIYIYT